MMTLIVWQNKSKKQYGFILRSLDGDLLQDAFGYDSAAETIEDAESVIGDEEYRIENYVKRGRLHYEDSAGHNARSMDSMDMARAEWDAKFHASSGLTVEELIEKLQQCKNKKAVASLCVDGLSYSAINAVIDGTCEEESDGNIGNALLTLDPQSEVALALEQLENA